MSATYYVGIDLGSRFHQVAVVDEHSRRVRPSFRIGRGRGGIELLMRTLAVPAGSLTVSIEATANYWWELVGALTGRGSRVYLISPKKGHDLRRFFALHTKTDVTDAEALARMPLVDTSLRPVWVAPPATASLLRLCRLRWKQRCRIADVKRRLAMYTELVMPGLDEVMPVRYSQSARLFMRRYLSAPRARRVGRQRMHAVLYRTSWGKFSDEKSERLWECIDNAPELGWHPDDLLLEADVQLDELETLEMQASRLDERIAELYGEVDPEQRLLVIPGLGEFLAAAITAHVGDISRFPSAKHLISYAGLDPRVHHTAGHSAPGQMISKHGSPFLRAWAYLGAVNARHHDEALKCYHDRLRARHKQANVAFCATAARLLERVHEVMAERRSATGTVAAS
jgi:transposase